MFKLVLPGNVNEIFAIIIPIITFDVLNNDYTTNLILSICSEGKLIELSKTL